MTTSSRCNTLQNTATHVQHTCNTLQHTATHCNTLQQIQESADPARRRPDADIAESGGGGSKVDDFDPYDFF